jgi:hypothetical protein
MLPTRLSVTCVPIVGLHVFNLWAPLTPMCAVPASSVATRVCGSPTTIASALPRSSPFSMCAVICFQLTLVALLVLLVSLAPLPRLTSSNRLGTLAWTLLALPTTYLSAGTSTFLVLSRLALPYSGALRLLALRVTIWGPSSTCSSPGVCSATCCIAPTLDLPRTHCMQFSHPSMTSADPDATGPPDDVAPCSEGSSSGKGKGWAFVPMDEDLPEQPALPSDRGDSDSWDGILG